MEKIMVGFIVPKHVRAEKAIFINLGDYIVDVQNYFSGPKSEIYFATAEEFKEIFERFDGAYFPRLNEVFEELSIVLADVDLPEDVTYILFR